MPPWSGRSFNVFHLNQTYINTLHPLYCIGSLRDSAKSETEPQTSFRSSDPKSPRPPLVAFRAFRRAAAPPPEASPAPARSACRPAQRRAPRPGARCDLLGVRPVRTSNSEPSTSLSSAGKVRKAEATEHESRRGVR